MKINDFFQKNRLVFISLYNILRSTYVLVLTIPILFNILSFNSIKTFSNETDYSINQTLLKNSRVFVDNMFNSVFSSAIQSSNNQTIAQLAYWDNSSSDNAYDLNQVNTVWNNINLKNKYIKQRYVYFPQTDSVYTGSTISSSHYHYMFVYNSETVMTEQIWKDTILNKNLSGLTATPSSNETRLFFVYPTYVSNSVEILYNIIVELDFELLLNDVLGENKNRFFMFSYDGTIIEKADGDEFNKIVKKLCSNQNYGQTYYKNSNGTEVFTTKSEISNWNYGYIANNEHTKKSMMLVRIITLVACLLCPLISLMIIGKREKGTQEIVEILPDSENAKDRNVHQQIKNTLTKLIRENADVNSKLFTQNNMLKEQILINMLHGKKNDKFSYSKQLYLVDIDLENAMFITIAFSATNVSQIFGDDDHNTSDNKKQNFAQLIISNIIYETLAKDYRVEWVSLDNISVAIVSLTQEQADSFKSDISCMLQTSFDIILSEFNFKAIATISNPHISLNCINDAYNESVLGMEYALTSNKQILFYDDLTVESKLLFSFDIEDDIKKCLEEKNYHKCKKIIENAIYRFQQGKELSSVITRAFSHELLTIFLRNVIQNTNDKPSSFVTDTEMNSIMSENTTTTEILLKTITIIERYLDKYDVEEAEQTEKGNFYLQIRNYIDEHYADTELCLVGLANIFKINSTYLSGQFKKEFDISISDYLTSVRIETAKKVLLTTDYKNAGIAKIVGYSNTRTFLRAFSKYVGVTPKEYRRINNPST